MKNLFTILCVIFFANILVSIRCAELDAPQQQQQQAESISKRNVEENYLVSKILFLSALNKLNNIK
jgi:hypothetical protein